MATKDYVLTCLSPVHIGTGKQFTKLEGLYSDGKWWLVDLDKTLAQEVKADELVLRMNDRGFSWSRFLLSRGIDLSNIASYGLLCSTDPGELPIREAMKNVYLQPYIPGSAIKGAIRTAVLWQLITGDASYQAFATQYLTLCLHARELFQEFRQQYAFDRPDLQQQIMARLFNIPAEEVRGLQQTLYESLDVQKERLPEARESKNFQRALERLGQKREWLGQPIERAVLGGDPNHDLMRALQVSDSKPLSIDLIDIGLIWTYSLDKNRLVEKHDNQGDYRTFAEWISSNARTAVSIRADEYLFTDPANSRLKFRGAREQAIRNLAQTCNTYCRSVIRTEKEFYGEHGLYALEDFYSDLEEIIESLPQGAFMLNIGWGGGWEFKTLGNLIKQILSKPAFNQLRQRYRLGEDPKTRELHLNAPFPHTRHIAYDGGAPRWSMGWVVLDPLSR